MKLEKDPSLSIGFPSTPSIVDIVIIFFENPCVIALLHQQSVKVKRKGEGIWNVGENKKSNEEKRDRPSYNPK